MKADRNRENVTGREGRHLTFQSKVLMSAEIQQAGMYILNIYIYFGTTLSCKYLYRSILERLESRYTHPYIIFPQLM